MFASIKDNRTPATNITYTQTVISCFLGQESSKFIVPFFVVRLVDKTPTAHSRDRYRSG